MSLDNMKKRVSYTGYDYHDKKNIDIRRKSFIAALRGDQAENITFNNNIHRCLINKNKITNEYDDKIISIDFSSGMKPGDTFYWHETDTHWIVFKQEIANEAYFMANIRRCDYQVNGYWVYLRGPVETSANMKNRSVAIGNNLNYSMVMYITKNEETLAQFSRLAIITIEGHKWRVAATDKFSQPGIIEVELEEYFDNVLESAEEISQKEEERPHEETELYYIKGLDTVYCGNYSVPYEVVGIEGGHFEVDASFVSIYKSDDKKCYLDINTKLTQTFNLKYIVNGLVLTKEITTVRR